MSPPRLHHGLALNAQRKINSVQAWVDLIQEANSYYNWDLLFVPECDGVLSADSVPPFLEGAAVHRWWPGV